MLCLAHLVVYRLRVLLNGGAMHSKWMVSCGQMDTADVVGPVSAPPLTLRPVYNTAQVLLQVTTLLHNECVPSYYTN